MTDPTPLTPEEIGHLRNVVARELRGEDNGAWATSVIARLLATLDAARQSDPEADETVQATVQDGSTVAQSAPEAGLREAQALAGLRAEVVCLPTFPTMDPGPVDDPTAVEAAGGMRKAVIASIDAALDRLATPAPDDWKICPTGYVPEDHAARLCKCATPAPDTAARDRETREAFWAEHRCGDTAAHLAWLRDGDRLARALVDAAMDKEGLTWPEGVYRPGVVVAIDLNGAPQEIAAAILAALGGPAVTLEGIDISHHQATTPDLSGVDFVICRATYGATPDRKYPEHAAAVRAAGKVLGLRRIRS